jgi:hypothetical protein
MAPFSGFSSLARICSPKKSAPAVQAVMTALLATLCAAPASATEAESARRGVEPGARTITVGPGSLRVDSSAWAARLDLRLPAASDDGIGRAGWQLLGDYYFSALGGLRATGGVLGQSAVGRQPSRLSARANLGEMASHGRLWQNSSDAGTATYVGLGYSSTRAAAGWGLSADLGLLALRESAGVRLGSGDPAGADWPQELRLRPMLQLGVSYSF